VTAITDWFYENKNEVTSDETSAGRIDLEDSIERNWHLQVLKKKILEIQAFGCAFGILTVERIPPLASH